jgi:hypothetical protein
VTPEEFKRELIKRAQGGDAEAGREILNLVVGAINSGRFDQQLFPFLADALVLYLKDGVELDRALGVEQFDVGGAPTKYDPDELAAVDVLLQFHLGRRPEQAISWIQENIGADRRAVQRLRNQYGINEYYSNPKPEHRDTLMHMAGSLRQKIAEVIMGKNPG